MASSHEQHKKMTTSDIALFGGVGAAGAVIASPYVLPLLNIGTHNVDRMLNICSQGAGEFGKGAAGFINEGFSHIPAVGDTLALGGWGSAIASSVIGLGGVMLGNYIEEHYDQEGKIPWGKIIKYAAITTSVLIALPSILSAISMGVTFLAMTMGASSAVGTFMSGSLGFMGGMEAATAFSGIAGLLPHLVTCGLGILPVAGTAILAQKTSARGEKPENTLQTVDFRERLNQAHQAAIA